MLPAADLSEILTNLSALNLQPNTAAQILAARLARVSTVSMGYILYTEAPFTPAPAGQRRL